MSNTYADTITDAQITDLFHTHGVYDRVTSQWKWNGYALRDYGRDGGIFIYAPNGFRTTTAKAYEALMQI